MSRLDRPGAKHWRIATGHVETSAAAAEALDSGGNAADAAIAAAATACISEPLLCSLGGGALALLHRPGRAPLILDAFTQTPRRRRMDGLDFYPIIGHFGNATQEFHVGLASMATPGALAGLVALSARFGNLPLSEALAPAVRRARSGVAISPIQRYTLDILEPIVRASPATARLFGLSEAQGPLPAAGTAVANPDLADFLETFGREGPDCFYRGEPAQRLAEDATLGGGHLQLADLSNYRTRWRRPLRWRYRDAILYSVPPPAFGGMMLALAMNRLSQHALEPASARSADWVDAILDALDFTDRVRCSLETPAALASETALKAAFHLLCQQHPLVSAGTTHISVLDAGGMGVALTLSNGEGSGYVIPGTGIHMNNMLGEEDINRGGFHAWPCNRRLASMMAPCLLRRSDRIWLLGSGGSNRIRSALTQVIGHLIDHDLSLAEAIAAPRVHLEASHLSVEQAEHGWPADVDAIWSAHAGPSSLWPARNLYFGGVNAVSDKEAAADPRRGGAALSADKL